MNTYSPTRAVAIAAILICTSTGCAFAADFFIADGDVSALIAAIDTANANGESNAIHLAAGGTYTLSAVHNDGAQGPTGLPMISSSLTIHGNGATFQRSPFAPAFRFFRAGSFASLTINDLTMLGGTPGSGGGGAIRSGALPGLTLNNCTFDSCAAGFGGAVYIGEGVATLNGCTFTWCFAGSDGGAIYNFDGDVALLDCSMSNCLATRGGAIFNAENRITITGGAITECSATQGGGGIYATAEVTLTGLAIIDNSGGGGSGGGGILSSAALTASGCVISGNSADEGGGIRSTAGLALLTLTDCTITGNSAGIRGGGLLTARTTHLTGSTISGNSANPHGGGVYISSATVTVVHCTISGNSSRYGGGIHNFGGTLTLTDSTISANWVASDLGDVGGGGLYTTNGSVTVIAGTISGNSASDFDGRSGDGGGIFNVDSSLTLTNSTISGNFAALWGGGIYSTLGDLMVTNCTISDNWGAGIYTLSGATLTNTIVAYSNEGFGGDIWGAYTDAGFNIVEDGVGVSHPASMSGDPNLGPLAVNGGPTRTHALLPGSIAIETGNCSGGAVTHDQRGVERPQGKACDIGAFEIEHTSCSADLTGNGAVDVQDLLILLSAWGPCENPGNSGGCPADLNDSGAVDVQDLLILLSAWGPCP